MIRQLLSIRSLEDFQNFALTFPDPSTIWQTFTDALRNPGLNPTTTALSVFTIVVLLCIVAVFVAYFIIRYRENREINQEIREFEDAYLEKHPEQKEILKKARFHARVYIFALTVFGFFILLLGVNGLTGASVVCKSCHIESAHVDLQNDAIHGKTRCVSCHEAGGFVSSTVLSLGPRISHFAAGMRGATGSDAEDVILGSVDTSVVVTTDIPAEWTLDATRVSGRYGAVNSASCTRCHGDAIDEGTLLNESTGIRVRHSDFLELNSRCLDCHGVDDESGTIVMTAGMSNCINCHDGQTASADCTSCHTKDIGTASASRRMVGSRPELVQEYDCYSCHKSAGCDSCHGIRIPHSQEFMTTGLHAFEGAKSLWRGANGTCAQCHNEKRRSCTERCHGELPYHAKREADFARSHADGYVGDSEENPQAGMSCDTCHAALIQERGQSICDACHSLAGAK